MRRVYRQREELDKAGIDAFHVVPQLERILQVTHVACQYRADAGAMRKEKIDDHDLPFQLIERDGIAQLVLQRDVGDPVPDSIVELFSVLYPGDNAVGEKRRWHRYPVLACYTVKDKRYDHRDTDRQPSFLAHGPQR